MKDFLFLSIENVPIYFLKRLRPKLPQRVVKLIQVQEVISYSNNNYLFRLLIKEGEKNKVLYLKQAQRFNKRSMTKGEPMYVSPGRIIGEVKVIRKLNKLWGRSVVPDVLYFDRSYNAFLMSDVGTNKLLIDEFKKNQIHPEIASTLGYLLGTLHSKTWGTKLQYCGDKSWLRLLKNYVRSHYAFGIKKFVSPAKIKRLYRLSDRQEKSLIWGDPVYRNMFVHPKGKVSMIDFDMAYTGDPAFDIGLLISHWLWMMVHQNKKVEKDSLLFLKKFISHYRFTILKKINNEAYLSLIDRAKQYSGLYTVSRTDGESGSYFKKWPAWEKRIRRLGIDLFLNESSFKNILNKL